MLLRLQHAIFVLVPKHMVAFTYVGRLVCARFYYLRAAEKSVCKIVVQSAHAHASSNVNAFTFHAACNSANLRRRSGVLGPHRPKRIPKSVQHKYMYIHMHM